MSWLPRQTVVVPIDFSADSFASLEAAREITHEATDIHIVHVLPVLEATDPGVVWQLIDDGSRQEHALKALQAELEARDWHDMPIEILFGDPGHKIADYASSINAGLVIIASHGKAGLKHLLLGSVAERVVKLVHCPVLVLKHK